LPLPAPLSLAETGPVVLFFTPSVVALTCTVTEQNPLARFVGIEALVRGRNGGGPAGANAPPLNVISDPPMAPVTVPPQVLSSIDATCNPAGKVSLNAIPVSVTLSLGLPMVNCRPTVPFSPTASAPKVLLMLGGKATVTSAEAVLPVPPLVEVTLPVVL